MSADLCTLNPTIPTAWTPIASRRRDGPDAWTPVDGAPMTLTDARRLFDRGLLLMAQRVEAARTFVVVKAPTQEPRWR